MLRQTLVLTLLALLLAGCDQKALLNRFVPKDDDAFARHFLDVVRAGDYAAADQMLDASLRAKDPTAGLHDLNGALAHGEPVSVEVIGCFFFANSSPQGATRTTHLSYQIRFPDSWSAGDVFVVHPAGAMAIQGSYFAPIPESLETLHRFTFSGKSLVHYLFFLGCLAVPALIVGALLVCFRTRIRRKGLWIVFILLGLTQLQLNWTTGEVGVQPLAFSLLGAGAFRPGPYAPWILRVGLPAGAMLFLAFRRRLLLKDIPQGTKSDAAAPGPPPLPSSGSD